MQALAFNDVLPWDGQRTPVVQENGRAFLRLREKGAREVSLLYAEKEYRFHQTGEAGEWELELPFHEGISYVQLLVDGREVLSPLLPIVYGYSRPYNCVELRTENDSYYQLRDVPHGTLRREYFFSQVTEEWESCVIYTPPGYEEHPEIVYPVLYLQHGHGENETGWTAAGRANLILDNLIAAGEAVPFVIVMNNGMVQKRVTDEAGRTSHMVDHLLLEPMLLRDVIPFVEGRYHAGRSKDKRGMAGLSMGSMQTSMIVMRHPELFSEVGIFSGFLQDWISGSELDMSGHAENKNAHLAAMKDSERFNHYFHTLFRSIGDKDPFMEFFLEDDRLCEENQIQCTRMIYHGAHDWNVWRECFRDFAKRIFRQSDTAQAN
ncbi:alpha/beta hydrolase-fold protein [Lachnoclostridium sp. Marseille-P6806]|uniref:alpha/beta hydrolase-fold protein n=1 Tax=Lachnoclostridium sp. Marseille-P6806 TaxID=2364793 RepID=UPI00102FF2C4|nr:alpha/beta hydrolase-fold protein [Lachnoclostridium sp. Marseille-P6806]